MRALTADVKKLHSVQSFRKKFAPRPRKDQGLRARCKELIFLNVPFISKILIPDWTIQYGYIIEANILYYPIRNGWKFWYGKNCLFYYKSMQDCRSHDLQYLGLKIHNFSLELKQSKTPPAASCWIISTLVRRYVFFNPRFCKSWDCPNLTL